MATGNPERAGVTTSTCRVVGPSPHPGGPDRLDKPPERRSALGSRCSPFKRTMTVGQAEGRAEAFHHPGSGSCPGLRLGGCGSWIIPARSGDGGSLRGRPHQPLDRSVPTGLESSWTSPASVRTTGNCGGLQRRPGPPDPWCPPQQHDAGDEGGDLGRDAPQATCSKGGARPG